MKRELAITGIALVVSILLSSPSFAQTTPPESDTAAKSPPVISSVIDRVMAEELSLDEAILFASTPEERRMLMMRCAGPPPRLPEDVADAKREPVTPEG